jgi:hypothetical protein
LSKKIDAEGNTIVEFESLELEEGAEAPPSKLNKMLATLKEKLEPDDYAAVLSDLGLEGEDLSNAELLEKFTELVQELVGAKEEDKEKPDEDEEDEEKEMMDRKEFIKQCMEEGKDLEACSEEFKKKYPEPAEKKEEDAELGEKKGEETELAKRLTDLEGKYADLLKEKDLAGISAKVEELVKDKHMAPVQKEMAIKLAAKLDPGEQDEFLEFFRTTQRFTVNQDVGLLSSEKPGVGGADITVERREELIKLHGLDGLIDDKADKTRLPWRNN